jgi:kinesin family protein 6/9
VIERKIVNVDKNQAYQEYNASGGLELNNSILRNIEELKQKKEEIKQMTEEAQKKKNELEQIQLQLKQKEENKTQEEINKNIIDEEEFELIKKKKM